MTVAGSTCTRISSIGHSFATQYFTISRLPCRCGHINRLIIPLTLFLLSRPLEQLEFIRFSNSHAEILFVHLSLDYFTFCPTDNAPTQLPKSISTTSLQSKTSLSNHPREMISSPKLSSPYSPRTRISHHSHSISEEYVETNIVALHDHIPQRISLPDPPFLRSRRHSRHRSFSLSLARAVRWYIFDESFMYKTIYSRM